MMESRIALAAIFLTTVTIVSTFLRPALSQDRTMVRETFFEGLMGGGAENGVVYLEIQLKKRFFATAKTSKERWAVWDTFFSRVLHEPSNFNQVGKVPYWGDFAYQKVDWSTVADAVDVRVGYIFRVRTPTSEGLVKIARYAIHHSVPGGANLLLAVAHPVDKFKVPDTDIIFASPRLPPCGNHCRSKKLVPDVQTLESLRKAAARGAKIPEGQKFKRMIAFEGSFTRSAKQYVVYVYFGTDLDYNLTGYWRTIIVDTDLSIIGVVGENEYSHIEPRSTGDVDGDGLDEVWVGLSGYEGEHAGLIYWRGGGGHNAFSVIANAYYGA